MGQYRDRSAALAGAILLSVPSLLAFLSIPELRSAQPEISIPLKVTGSLLGNGVGGTCVALASTTL
jgi:hypothetical protein